MRSLLLIAVLLTCQFGSTQKGMKDFFTNKTQVVFLGMDFTQCKFIGKDNFNNPKGLKNHAIKAWNRFLATEPGKYSLQDAFKLKDKYYYNSINYFLKRNEAVNTYKCITNKPHTITEESVAENVATYTTFEKEGLAVSFVVESFDGPKGIATVWVCYIDLPENRIIYKEKMTGKAGGIGQVNYWARSIYDIVSQIKKKANELKNK